MPAGDPPVNGAVGDESDVVVVVVVGACYCHHCCYIGCRLVMWLQITVVPGCCDAAVVVVWHRSWCCVLLPVSLVAVSVVMVTMWPMMETWIDCPFVCMYVCL